MCCLLRSSMLLVEGKHTAPPRTMPLLLPPFHLFISTFVFHVTLIFPLMIDTTTNTGALEPLLPERARSPTPPEPPRPAAVPGALVSFSWYCLAISEVRHLWSCCPPRTDELRNDYSSILSPISGRKLCCSQRSLWIWKLQRDMSLFSVAVNRRK